VLKILVLFDTLNVVGGRPIAGASAREYQLNRELTEQGHDVRFMLGDVGCSGGWAGWPWRSYLMHYDTVYEQPQRMVEVLDGWSPDMVVATDGYAILMYGRWLADRVGARLVYEMHDDEPQLLRSLGGTDGDVDWSAVVQRAAVQASDLVVTLSPVEAELVRVGGFPPERLHWSPMGVDLAEQKESGPCLDEPVLAFVGNLYYEPNARAATALVERILPALRERGTADPRALIIGRIPDELRRELSRPGVTVTGLVPSVAEALVPATMGVAPIDAGSGMKSKILDYLAAGLPVVCSTHAAAGYPVDDLPLHIADDPARFADHVVRLWRDPAAMVEMGHRGREVAEHRYGWDSIARVVGDVYRRIRDLPPAGGVVPGDLAPRLRHRPYWQVELEAKDAWAFPRVVTAETYGLCVDGQVSVRGYA